jgi:hypothetical protein
MCGQPNKFRPHGEERSQAAHLESWPRIAAAKTRAEKPTLRRPFFLSFCFSSRPWSRRSCRVSASPQRGERSAERRPNSHACGRGASLAIGMLASRRSTCGVFCPRVRASRADCSGFPGVYPSSSAPCARSLVPRGGVPEPPGGRACEARPAGATPDRGLAPLGHRRGLVGHAAQRPHLRPQPDRPWVVKPAAGTPSIRSTSRRL